MQSYPGNDKLVEGQLMFFLHAYTRHYKSAQQKQVLALFLAEIKFKYAEKPKQLRYKYLIFRSSTDKSDRR
jgi:hypothetical protein